MPNKQQHHSLSDHDIQVDRNASQQATDLWVHTDLQAGLCETGSKIDARSCCDAKGMSMKKQPSGLWTCISGSTDRNTGDWD